MPFMRNMLAATLLAATPVTALGADATAELSDRNGNLVGTVDFASTASGMVHIIIVVDGIPVGEHAIHIHETGDCSAEDFTSAGGHFALDREHGVHSEHGPHPGDLPNIHVGADDPTVVEYFVDAISLEDGNPATLFDADGSAVVIHAGADDYQSQPAGDAGARIACGVISR